MRGFYELKYRVIETFYDVLSDENYSYNQAADRCYSEFYQEVKSKDVESVIVILTIGLRLLKHKSISGYHLSHIKDAIDIYENRDFESKLNKADSDVLAEEIQELKIELKI